jgi:phosphoglycolate phosphatase-like HAD superfamily hydrolase
VTPPAAIAIDLDGVLGDTRPLWVDWLGSAARVLGIDSAALPDDRGEAAAVLDADGAGNWRALLERFAEDRAPIYLRRDAETSGLLRRLAESGTLVGVFSDAPAELVQTALSQLGATRRVDAVEAGAGALDRLLASLGHGTLVVRTREEFGGVTS